MSRILHITSGDMAGDAIEGNLIEAEVFDRGIRELYRTSETDGVFCYTFFKGMGKKV
jgi:hypothetical protein